jgi:hypothetical protein
VFLVVCLTFSCSPAGIAAFPDGVEHSQGADQLRRGFEVRSDRTSWIIATSRDGADGGREFGSPGAKVASEGIRLDSIEPRARPADGFVPAPSRQGKRAKAPQVRIGDVDASKGIPIDVIRRIVRQNYGRYRACYENGLKRDSELQGKVGVGFVIERDGGTSNLRDGGSTLPDVAVIRCIMNAVGGLAFPKPQGPWAPPDGETMKVLMQVWLTPG